MGRNHGRETPKNKERDKTWTPRERLRWQTEMERHRKTK